MRAGLDAGTLALYNSQRFDTHYRLNVANGSGTLQNLDGRYKALSLQLPNPNLPIGQLEVSFVREGDALTNSLAPFVTASTLNRLNDGTTYSPLLQLGRLVTLEVALTAPGGARPAFGSATWYYVFYGIISAVKWPERYGRTASITCLDATARLQKSKSEAAYTYTAGTAIETAIQQVLTNNGHTWVTFSCPVATGKVLPNDYAPGVQKTVWEQVWALAQSMGWVIWFRFTGQTGLALTLFEPSRSKTVPDQTVSVINDFTDFGIDETQIGNVGYIRFYDADGVEQELGPFEDTASISVYGGATGIRRAFWIKLGADSPVRSSVDATALMTAALADVSDPDVLATVTMPPTWFAEVAVDLYSFPTIDGRLFDTSQTAAPFAVTVGFQEDRPPVATLSLRGKPSIGARAWSLVGGGEAVSTGTSDGLNSLKLPDVIDSFQLGPYVPYISAGGATDAWPRRPFTVNTESDLTTWSLGGLFMERAGNVAANGPQGIENYLKFVNSDSIAGPSLGIISNAELAGTGGNIAGGLALFTGGLVISSSGQNVTGTLTTYDAGGVNRVSGATSIVSAKVIGFRGRVPSTSAAVTGELWNLYMDGTAMNYLAARLYLGSTTEATYLERLTTNVLGIGGTLKVGSQTSGRVLIVGDQSATGANSLTSGVGQEIYADGNNVFAALHYANRDTGTSAGLSFQWGLQASAGASPAKRALIMQVQKSGVWDGTTTNQNADLQFRLIKDGATATTLQLSSKGNLTLMGMGTGGGVGVFGLLDATTAPTSTPAGGSIIWSTGGVLKTRSAMDALGGFYVNGSQVVTPTGTLAPGSVANAAAFAASIKPIEVWTYATLPVSPAANTIAFVTDWPLGGGPTGPRMARWSGSAWVALAAADQIVGQLTAGSIAAGAVTASAINVSTLSAIAANLGTVTAGVAQNAAGTRYLDLSAGTANFLQHEKLSLKHDGSAFFSGSVQLLIANTNALEFWDGANRMASFLPRASNPYTSPAVFLNYDASARQFGFYDTGTTGEELLFRGLNSLGTLGGIYVGTNGLVLDGGGVVQSGSIVTTAGVKVTGRFGLNVTPIAKPTVTGSRASNAALASLITAFANYGFITDSTT